MNRKNLTAAILAGLAGVAGIAGTAQAVNVNPDGLGQVLLYPYYTTNDDNITVLSVVNTSEDAKAVKVRFLEGENSREVLDFNMYMSGYDVWTAAIYDDAGTPTMMTTDTTCTVPYIYGAGGVQEFLPWALTDAEYNDNGPPPSSTQKKTYGDISRGAEGHFEIIEMGTLVDDTVDNTKWVNVEDFPFCETGSAVEYGNPSGGCTAPTGAPVSRSWTAAELAQPATLTTRGSATAATHKNGVPNNCPQLVAAWTRSGSTKPNGYWITDAGVDIDAPSGGLFGGAALVNIEVGSMYSYDAKAIDGFYVDNNPNDYDYYVGDKPHQEPGTILPSLDSGNSRSAAIFFNGDTFDSWEVGDHLDRSVDAVSFVLMHDSIMNEYVTDSAIGASTEWVLTFPTKQFYVHQAFLDDYAKRRANNNTATGPKAPIDPFTSTWKWTDTTYKQDASGNYIVNKPGFVTYPCEIVQLDSIWDREEGTIVPEDAPPGTPVPPIVSPAPPSATTPGAKPVIPFALCYETSVIAFGDGSNYSILGSANTHTIDNTELGFESGWARLDLWDASWDANKNGVIEDVYDASNNLVSDEVRMRDDLGGLLGLPVTGFAVTSFVNAFLGDGADVLANYGGIFTHKGTRKIGSYDNLND